MSTNPLSQVARSGGRERVLYTQRLQLNYYLKSHSYYQSTIILYDCLPSCAKTTFGDNIAAKINTKRDISVGSILLLSTIIILRVV